MLLRLAGGSIDANNFDPDKTSSNFVSNPDQHVYVNSFETEHKTCIKYLLKSYSQHFANKQSIVQNIKDRAVLNKMPE